ncbi:MAG: hypothetical protein AAF808_04400 [Cyanobacteria bacterium P01_D01_bin.2]
MDKRQLRQSAMADFMQSLEHLDELLGDAAETEVPNDGPQISPKTHKPDQPNLDRPEELPLTVTELPVPKNF